METGSDYPDVSFIITAKDTNDPKLKELLHSIATQDYNGKAEILTITEGDSESAKAIGLYKAKAPIVCILASDNYLPVPFFVEHYMSAFKHKEVVGAFPVRYFYSPKDDILNRYFALMGVNDPIPLYLGKNDKIPYFVDYNDKEIVDIEYVKTMGDNGFFIRRNILKKADTDHYYHIDVIQDLFNLGYKKYAISTLPIWHRTGGNIVKFFLKRFRYADKFAVTQRRWHMVEKQDRANLYLFIFYTLTLLQPLYVSVIGYRKIKDKAWFLHLPICMITLGVYGLWVLKRVLSSVLTSVRKPSRGA